MHNHSYWTKISSTLRFLSTAIAVLEGRPPEQQARILARLVSVILFITLLITPIWLVMSPDFPSAQYISVGLIGALCTALVMSRIGRIHAAAALVVFSLIALVFATFFTAPGPLTERMITLNFLILVVMVTGLILPQLTLPIITLSLATIGVFFFVPDAPFTSTFAYLVFFLSIFSLGGAYSQVSGKYKQQLFESEERYRSVVTALSEGVILMSKEGNVETFNTAAERILGITPQQLQGRNVLDPTWLAIREDGTPFRGEDYPLIVTLKTGQPLSGAVMGLTHPDGQLHWISINSQPLVNPGEERPYAAVASLTDITARKQDERALQEAQIWYHSLFEQRHDAVFILDLEGRHLEANRRAAELLGYSVEEIQHLTFRDLSVEPAQSEEKLARLLAGDSLPMYERKFRKKDGSEIPVEINVELVRTLDGQPLHIQSVVRDITGRKQTQQNEFDLALEKERTHVLTTFVHDASHEFRTPLSIINTTAFVMARLQDQEKRYERARLIQEQIMRIVKLTEMLLLITRLEGTPLQDQVVVDIGQIFDLVCQRLQKDEDTHPQVLFTTPPDLPSVVGNPEELMEAFRQILENAYRFSPGDGVITAVTGHNDTHVWLLVHDSGPGIRPENLPHIFEMFWREDEAHSTPGLGLGLAIAQKIINRHGGKIEAVSDRGMGSTFHIFLPITNAAD
ncbi:MAG: PAS domain S-box protein [Anaerolineaceae bacterium]|nr:PAS domain S-box protein [Anaerolineaceae bacterium]